MNDALGFDLGLEATFIPRGDLLSQGNRTAVVPKLIPVPRVWFSWDIPLDMTISGSWAPGGIYDGVEAYGLGLQWRGYFEEESKLTFSGVAHFTYADAFGDLQSRTMGGAVQMSRDLDTWQPYAGVGLLICNGWLRDGLQIAGSTRGPVTIATSHLYAGVRLEMSGQLSFQFDLAGSHPSFAMLLSTSF
jgi:hypothetical protein